MKKYNFLFIAFVLQIIPAVTYAQKQKADLIVFNAKVYTVDTAFTIDRAFAITDGRFVAVGSTRDIRRNFESDVLLDAQDRFIYPGFNDGHSHFLGYGLTQTKYANLVGTKSLAEVIDTLLAHQKKYPSEWVLGRGWDQNDWQNKSWPAKAELDEAFPDKPVVITRIDGHAVLLNSIALQRAGISAQTTKEGGEILLADGKPTGLLIDNAIALVRKVIPVFGEKDKTIALLKAQEDCFAVGLTTVTDAGLDKPEIELIERLQNEGKLMIKVYAMLNPTKENMNYYFPKGPLHNGSLTVSSVKLYADGALGSRGALLLEPYADDPAKSGLQLHPLAFYESVCKQAYDAGFQVNSHAIGDSGNRIILQTYMRVLKKKNNRRWRVEHAQVVSPEDLHYFGDYSIIPSVQATHCTSDMYWAGARLGPERIKTAYAYKHLLRQNDWLINGTDFPVEGIQPLKTFYAAVARMDAKGWPEEGFQMEDAISREEALQSITIWPAWGSFDEKEKGSIEVGKFADFVILDKDLITTKAGKLTSVKVMATYLNGKKVYSAE